MQTGSIKYFILLIASCFINDFASAQDPSAKKDSTILYKNIESFSSKRKVTKYMYGLIFKPVAKISKKKEIKKRVNKNLIQKPYSTFEGKIVRKIDIVTLDPFGYSAIDTAAAKQTRFDKAVNKIHVKTQGIAIRNLLLFRRDKPFNSLLVKESERLIRTQTYVHEVSFFVVPAGPGKQSDSVDIYIRESDAWSIIPAGSISGSGFGVGLTDKNILGTGNEFQSAFSRNFTNGINAVNANYSIPNIRNTYVKSLLNYGFDGYKNYNRGLTIDRPFFSPVAKWAGGVSFSSHYKKDSVKYVNLVYDSSNFKYRTQDYWAGVSHQIFKGTTEEKFGTNLIFAARYLHIRYFEKPSVISDPFQVYSNEDFYFTAIGISSRRYVQDKFVFKYGIIEDVPVGRVFGLTGGYQVKRNTGRLYLGMKLSFGNYNRLGYFSSDFEYGTFIHASHTEESVLTAGINYFTRMLEVGKWKFRQFVKPQLTIGLNQFYANDLTLNDGYGLDGFNSPTLSGTNRIVFLFQTQSYSPWNLLGFRFGPYLTYSFGMLSDNKTPFIDSKVYSQIGLGVLIKNANLVFNTFQVSISFYPLIPGYGQNIFRTNSFSTTDFGLRDFEIGKPATVIYR